MSQCKYCQAKIDQIVAAYLAAPKVEVKPDPMWDLPEQTKGEAED